MNESSVEPCMSISLQTNICYSRTHEIPRIKVHLVNVCQIMTLWYVVDKYEMPPTCWQGCRNMLRLKISLLIVKNCKNSTSKLWIFSTSDISYQMCYCCQKLEICHFHWNSASLAFWTLWQICLIQSGTIALSDRSVLSNQITRTGSERPICVRESDLCKRVRSVQERPLIWWPLLQNWPLSQSDSPTFSCDVFKPIRWLVIDLCERVQSVQERLICVREVNLCERGHEISETGPERERCGWRCERGCEIKRESLICVREAVIDYWLLISWRSERGRSVKSIHRPLLHWLASPTDLAREADLQWNQ